MENTKIWYQSKEMWIVMLGILNYLLAKFGLPSFEPTAEFYGSLMVVMGALRAYWTSSRLVWSK